MNIYKSNFWPQTVGSMRCWNIFVTDVCAEFLPQEVWPLTKVVSPVSHKLWEEFPCGDQLCQVSLLNIRWHEPHRKEAEPGEDVVSLCQLFSGPPCFSFQFVGIMGSQIRQHSFVGMRAVRCSLQSFVWVGPQEEPSLKKNKEEGWYISIQCSNLPLPKQATGMCIISTSLRSVTKNSPFQL